jgi:hypothetical protein
MKKVRKEECKKVAFSFLSFSSEETRFESEKGDKLFVAPVPRHPVFRNT